MSIIAFEGFDHYGTSFADLQTGPLTRTGLWQNAVGVLDTIQYETRNGGNAMLFESSTTNNSGNDYTGSSLYLGQVDMASTTNLIGGIAFKPLDVENNNTAINPNLLWFSDGTNGFMFNFRLVPSATPDTFDLGISRMSVEQGTVTGLAENVYHYLEWDIKVDAPTHLKVWVNGSLEIDQTGMAASPGLVSTRLGCVQRGFGSGWYFDDMYLLDANDAADGAEFQSALGPISIAPTTLSADATSGMTAQGGGDRYVEVDESPGPSDLDTTYMYGTQPGDSQTFSITGVDDTNPILAVQSTAVVRKDANDTTSTGYRFIQTKGSTANQDTGLIYQETYRMVSETVTALPDASTLNKANIEATEWGVDIT